MAGEGATMREIPPYPKYGYFRRMVASIDPGCFHGNCPLSSDEFIRKEMCLDAQLADLSMLAYADKDFIAKTLKTDNSPFNLVDVIEAGEIQAIVATYCKGIAVAFRGTRTLKIEDWIVDIQCKMNGKGIHEGFYDAFMPLLPDISCFANGLPTVFTGHSLGGALATVALNEAYSVLEGASLVTFGSPRVGNGMFAAGMNMKLDRARRYVHGLDIVPNLPMEILGYEHVSQACFLKRMPRPFLNVLTPQHLFDHIPTLYAERLWEAA